MSDERKKTLRTQGKYSDKTREKRLKDSPGEREPPEKKLQSRNSNGYQSNTSHDGIESESAVKYQDNSSYFFEPLNKKKEPIEINEPGLHILSETANGISKILYEPHFMDEPEAFNYYYSLNDSTVWNEKNIVIHGQEFPQPRLVAWYGPFPYSYSGVILEPKEMPSDVLRIKSTIESYLMMRHGIDITFNSVLLNWYQNGKHSVAWHSDDEMSMGIHPTIASVSLGETRRFEMRRKLKPYDEEISDNQVDEFFINLTSGSLLIMDGCMQQDWQHRVPKAYHDKSGRINLTFRTVYSLDNVSSEMSAKGYKSNQRTNPLPTASSYDKNIPLTGSYDENFPSLGHPSATVTAFEPEMSDHEMDVENTLPNNTSSNLACSNIKIEISEDFDISNMSEDCDDSAKYFKDNSQNRNMCVDANTNSLKYEELNFEHGVNKNAQTSNLPNNSDTGNPEEVNVELDESCADSSYLSLNHSYVSQDYLNLSHGNESDTSGQSVSSNLNVNAKEFIPIAMSPPVSEKSKEEIAPSAMSPQVPEESKEEFASSAMSPPVSEESKEKFAPSSMSSPKSEESCKYDSYSLEDLWEYEIDHMNFEDFYDYAYQLRDEISKRFEEFGRGSRQLEFLCDLMEEDLPERCQRKITARMLDISKNCHDKNQDNDRYNSKRFMYKQWGNQRRERSSSSQGSRFQDRPYRDSESGDRYFKRQNFHKEAYNEEDSFSEQHSEGKRVEKGNSNRRGNRRGNWYRGTNSRERVIKEYSAKDNLSDQHYEGKTLEWENSNRGDISKRRNFNQENNSGERTNEEYNEKDNFSEQISEGKRVEWGNSNRGGFSQRRIFNREGSARGRTSRGNNLAKRNAGRGESHKGGYRREHN